MSGDFPFKEYSSSDRYPPLRRMGISTDEQVFIARRLIKLLPQRGKVLDLGCGNGLITNYISKKTSLDLVCVDDWSEFPRERAEQIGKQEGSRAVFLSGLPQVPFPDGEFDSVFSVMYLYNLRKEGRQKLGAEVKRILKPQGKYIVVDTNVMRGMIKRDLQAVGFRLEAYSDENAFMFLVLSPS